MDSALRAAIEEHHGVDISTHGRKSGATRRIEIRLWHADGRIFLSGRSALPNRPQFDGQDDNTSRTALSTYRSVGANNADARSLIKCSFSATATSLP
jgi:hypothetical protein